MYADRNRQREGFKPGSLGVAIAMNAGVVAALMFANPDIIPRDPDGTMTIENIPLDPPPPPDPTPPKPKTEARSIPEHVDRVPAKVPTSPDNPFIVPPLPPLPPQPPVDVGTGTGTGTVESPPPALPVLVDASVDPRYAGQFQPDYPAEERRLERTGRVQIRVLIGVDGRVKQVEQVSATSDAFFRATQQRALAKWRFRPATRDGIPVERWRTMTVTFVLQDG